MCCRCGSAGMRPTLGAITAARLWGISAHTDQLVAGLIMKILGAAILWTVIAVQFFRWYALEHREGVDVLEWRDVDRDLDRARVKP